MTSSPPSGVARRFQRRGWTLHQTATLETSRYCAITVALCLLMAACGRAPHEDFLAQGAQLCQDLKWDDAIQPLKVRLLECPEDAAAHFYLGRCYLNGSTLYPAVAEGELDAALMLFADNGGHSPIPEFSDQYFELRCRLEIAKVYVRMLLIADENGAGSHLKQKILLDCRRKAAEAARVAPDAEDIKELEKILERFTATASPPVKKEEASLSAI